MKSRLITGLLTALSCSFVHSAGIPVVDAAAIAQMVQQLAQAQQTYQQITNQLNQAKQTYANFTGSRGMGVLYWNSSLRQMLPADYTQELNAVLSSGKAGLSGEALKYYNSMNLDRNCDSLLGARLSACQKEQAGNALMTTKFAQAQKRVEERSVSIQNLMGRINTAQDAKAIADYQARIQTETAALSAEKLRLDSIIAVQQAQQQIVASEKAAALRAETYRALTGKDESGKRDAVTQKWIERASTWTEEDTKAFGFR